MQFNPEKEYLNKLTQVLGALRDSGTHISLGAKPGEDALDVARQAWFKILYREIPLQHLEQAILDAFREKCGTVGEANSKSSKSLSAGEVLRRWRLDRAEALEKNRLERILAPKRCSFCRGTLQVTVYDPKIKQEITKACPFHKQTSQIS